MTLQELYEEIGGNYRNTLERMYKEERIEKFVLLFLKDTSYQTCLSALEEGRIEEAFRSAHTLKGVCMNLGFDELYQISREMTEYLRVDNLGRAVELLPEFQKCYEKHIQAITRYSEK